MGYPLHALLVLLCMSISVEAKVKHYKWEVGHVFWSPDCKEGVMIGINGRFPGPTIRARAGDTIVVELKNRLPTEGVVIHWHGIRQRGTPWADGTASISQCPINPDETFVYRFKVEKAGTHFYHGHYGMQRGEGLYGLLVVDPAEGEAEPLAYDGEHSLLLSDWWHQDSQAQMAGLSSRPFRWVGEPQTLLINGRGQYNCSLAAAIYSGLPGCEIKSDHCSPVVLQVEPNKTYRLRIASTTSLASLSLSIESHRMTVVEADGNYVEPFSVEQLEIYSGETYSVLITADRKPASNYWISLAVRGRLPNTLPALGIINYRPASPSKHPFNPPVIPPAWNDYNYSKSFTYRVLARQGTPKPPSNPHRTIVLLNTQTTIDGYIRWSLNNVSLVLPPTPYLGSMKYGLKNAFDGRKPSDGFSSTYNVMRPAVNTNSTLGSGVYKLEFNSTVDVVLQNANALAENVSEIHPWHLHGHDFWILGYGDGRFDAERDSKRFNLKNPPLRNSVVVFPYGWAAIRFVADNPGVWAFHCHIEPHLHMGMGVVFAEGVELVGKIPVEAMACGVTGRTLMKSHHP